jgi:AcrR family transcriptional regulator
MVGRPRAVSDAEVMAAVAAVLGRRGPGGLTLAEVGAEVGVSAPALMQRFGSKRALLLQFSKSEPGEVASHFARVRKKKGDPIEVLVRGLTQMASGMQAREELANNLAMLQMELTDPEFREHVVAHARETKLSIKALLDEAQEAGEIQADDTKRLTEAVYVTYSGTLLAWAIDGKGSLAAFMKRHLNDLLTPYQRGARPGAGW